MERESLSARPLADRDAAPSVPGRLEEGQSCFWPPRERRPESLASVVLHFEGRGPPFGDGGPRRLKTAGASEDALRCSLETDTQTDVLLGKPKSAICVQRFDDSLNSAIHTTYRTWLRSSSMHEPRDPPLKVMNFFWIFRRAASAPRILCGIGLLIMKKMERRGPWKSTDAPIV